ncbi:ubiquitin-conjugating enzyme E2 W isoform X1 [Columba livia]|uniref:ubiquitin-conjugating enzyme E2 W isoform X1 n=1 Tax=Columba livia TaxID=8932 RepID=UPI0031BB4D67
MKRVYKIQLHKRETQRNVLRSINRNEQKLFLLLNESFQQMKRWKRGRICVFFSCLWISTTLRMPVFQEWIVDMEGAPGTLYEGEKFQLLFKFSSRYPFDSPQVMFTGDNIPVHPHVYSNGHICLSILTEDWSPALSVQSVCLSIISMLSSCKEKRRPPDNSFYVRTCNKNPKKTKWWYHDDTC